MRKQRTSSRLLPVAGLLLCCVALAGPADASRAGEALLGADSVAAWVEQVAGAQARRDSLRSFRPEHAFPNPTSPLPLAGTTRVLCGIAGALGGLLCVLSFLAMKPRLGASASRALPAYQLEALRRMRPERLGAAEGESERKAQLVGGLLDLMPDLVESVDLALDSKQIELTPQELEVVIWTKLNLSTEEVALRMEVSPSHVYRLRGNLRKKIGIDRSQSLEAFLIAGELVPGGGHRLDGRGG